MEQCLIKVKRMRENATLPAQAKPGDAGYDVTAAAVEDCGDVIKVYTGIAIQPSPGWYVDLMPRSSIYKKGLMLANSVGIIDNGYRGEVIAIYRKMTGYKTREGIEVGEKVGQLIPRRLSHAAVEWAEELDETDRGAGGFGSTGA